MKSLVKLAAKFKKQLKLSQQVSYSDPIVDALTAAKLWLPEVSPAVAQLIAQVGIPNTTKIYINILVDNGPVIDFSVQLEPAKKPEPTPTDIEQEKTVTSKQQEALHKLLVAKFANTMVAVLKKANLNTETPVSIKWIQFT